MKLLPLNKFSQTFISKPNQRQTKLLSYDNSTDTFTYSQPSFTAAPDTKEKQKLKTPDFACFLGAALVGAAKALGVTDITKYVTNGVADFFNNVGEPKADEVKIQEDATIENTDKIILQYPTIDENQETDNSSSEDITNEKSEETINEETANLEVLPNENTENGRIEEGTQRIAIPRGRGALTLENKELRETIEGLTEISDETYNALINTIAPYLLAKTSDINGETLDRSQIIQMLSEDLSQVEHTDEGISSIISKYSPIEASENTAPEATNNQTEEPDVELFKMESETTALPQPKILGKLDLSKFPSKKVKNKPPVNSEITEVHEEGNDVPTVMSTHFVEKDANFIQIQKIIQQIAYEQYNKTKAEHPEEKIYSIDAQPIGHITEKMILNELSQQKRKDKNNNSDVKHAYQNISKGDTFALMELLNTGVFGNNIGLHGAMRFIDRFCDVDELFRQDKTLEEVEEITKRKFNALNLLLQDCLENNKFVANQYVEQGYSRKNHHYGLSITMQPNDASDDIKDFIIRELGDEPITVGWAKKKDFMKAGKATNYKSNIIKTVYNPQFEENN